MNKEFYTKTEFGEIIKKDPRTLNTLEKKGIISKGKRDGKFVFYKKEDVENALKYYEDSTDVYFSDIIITNNIDTINKISNNYNLRKFIVIKNINDLKNNVNNVNRLFIDNNFVNKKDINFLLQFAKIQDMEVTLINE